MLQEKVPRVSFSLEARVAGKPSLRSRGRGGIGTGQAGAVGEDRAFGVKAPRGRKLGVA